MAFATRCPQCGTIFQASGEQLTQCAGMVRCSVCKAPFNGIEHLLGRITPVKQKKLTRTQSTTVEVSAVVPQTNQFIESPSEIQKKFHSVQSSTLVETMVDVTATDTSKSVDSNSNDLILLTDTDTEKSLQEAFNQQLQSLSLEIDSPPEPIIEKTPAPVESLVPRTEPLEKSNSVLTNNSLTISSANSLPHVSQKKPSFLRRWLWLPIIIVLLLVAGLAAIYYYSKEIVEEVPVLKETIDTFCEQLSCSVDEHPATLSDTAEQNPTSAYETLVKNI